MAYQAIWDKNEGTKQGSLPAPTQGSTLETITILALYRDGSAIDLSSMTLSATMTDRSGATTAVTGTLTGANGSFTWKFSAGDIGTSGIFSVEFAYTDGAESWVSVPQHMSIIANPAATAVQNPALVGVSPTDAAWVSAGAAGGAIGTAAYEDTDAFDAAGSAAARVAKAGDTMTGALVLSGAPTIDLHAATKKYVDDNAGGGDAVTKTAATFSLLYTLNRDLADVNIVVLSDSTGDTFADWPGILATWLAGQYPAYSVQYHLWNGTDYDAPLSIQTGTGSNTLNVYIGGQSGQGIAYTTTNFAAMVPVTPNLIIYSTGHNDTANDASSRNWRVALDLALNTYPTTTVLINLQNPKTTASGSYANQLNMQLRISLIAKEYGIEVVNVLQAFFDDADYAANLMADDTHPNAAGMTVWADEVKRHFLPNDTSITPRAIQPAQNQIFIAAGLFYPTSAAPGAALVGVTNSTLTGWAFDPTTEEAVSGGYTRFPWWWSTADVSVIWSQMIAGITAVAWRVRWYKLDITSFIGASPGSIGTTTASTGQYQGGVKSTKVTPTAPWTLQSREYALGFQVNRVAADAGDTFPGDAVFLGLLFERKA